MDRVGQSSRQYPVVGRMPPQVRIVTDSASDILPSQARALGIILVPNRVALDGAIWQDGIDLTAAQFYAMISRSKSLPSTMPAAPEDLYAAYQLAFNQGATGIVSLHVSGQLSKVVEHALLARNAFSGNSVQVIDTLQAGIGMWPAILHAARLARAGASTWQIYDATLALLRRTQLYFMVDSLDYLRRSGRISWARERLGTLVDAHPILALRDGIVVPVETARPRSRALERLCALALESGVVEHLLICGTSTEAMSQLEAIVKPYYIGAIQNTWLGPTLGANTGPGVAISVVTSNQRALPTPPS